MLLEMNVKLHRGHCVSPELHQWYLYTKPIKRPNLRVDSQW